MGTTDWTSNENCRPLPSTRQRFYGLSNRTSTTGSSLNRDTTKGTKSPMDPASLHSSFQILLKRTESCATEVSSECSNPTLKCTWPPSSLTITTEEHSVPHKTRSPLKSVYSPQRQRNQSPLCTGRRTQAAKQLDDPSLQCFTLSADHQTRTPNPVKPNFDPTISVCPTAKQLDGRTMLIQAPGKTSPRPNTHRRPARQELLRATTQLDDTAQR